MQQSPSRTSSTSSTRTTSPSRANLLRTLVRRRGPVLRTGIGAVALLGVTAGVNALGESTAAGGAAGAAAAATITTKAAAFSKNGTALDRDPAGDAREARDLFRAHQGQIVEDAARAQAAQNAAAAAKAAAEQAQLAGSQRTTAAKAVAERAAAAQTARQAAQRTQSEASRGSSRDPRSIARAMLAARGWSGQFGCLDSLWQRESGWNPQAYNASSGAFGIPQALPGGKMASAGADWRTDPATQIAWGLGYIASTYGTPCGAWAHSQAAGWY